MTLSDLTAPQAKTVPFSFEHLGQTYHDPYTWLQTKTDPEVIAYLEAENAYAKSVLAHTHDLQEALYQEMFGRIKEDDDSVPERRGEYLYYSRVKAGHQYREFYRKHGEDGAEELLLDENALAIGLTYCRVFHYLPSPDQRLLAYAVDTTGSWVFTLYIKDLTTGEIVAGPFENTAWAVDWASDSRTIFFTVFNESHRSHKLMRHTVGGGEPVEVYHEADDSFEMSIDRTRSGAYLILSVNSHTTAEARYLAADDPTGTFTLIDGRRNGIEYYVDHHGDRFLIYTNEDAVNFKLMEAPVGAPVRENWRPLIEHRADTLIEAVLPFRDHLVMRERRDGMPQFRISKPDALTDVRYVQFPEPVYTAAVSPNPEFDTPFFRFVYMSPITPQSTVDYQLDDGTWHIRKQQEIPSGYDPTLYECVRLFANSHDGTRVPISMVYRKGMERNGQNPLLLYGYGSYGISMEASFNTNRFSLLDRGFVFAIAHIRGGSEIGRAWYENGKLMRKKNTFLDFIAAAEMLIGEGYTSPEKLAILGGSAGGLLTAAVANMRPDLFKAVVSMVPFTNVITAMLDPTLPLTVPEWEQWGNPTDAEAFAYMLSYSPYENIEAKAYPNMYVKAGLNDLQVPYWDPAKYVARLRAHKTDDNRLLLVTNMGAGHHGSSGRYDILREEAQMYAFLIDTVIGSEP